VSHGLPVEGLGDNGEGRWRAAHGSSSSGERRLEFRRDRVGNGEGAWSRSSRARRGPDSETQLKKRKVGRGSSTWSRGRRQWRWATAVGVHAIEAWAAWNGSLGMEGVRREVALQLGAATKARRWMSRRWPVTSNDGSPKQEGKRGGARGRRQQRGGRAVEDPQATRGLAQWLEVEFGARRR
jgi:hypothetical protein